MMINGLAFFIGAFFRVSDSAFSKILIDFPQVEDMLVFVAAASVFDLG